MSALAALLGAVTLGYLGVIALLLAGIWSLVIWLDEGSIDGGEAKTIAVFALCGIGLLWLASSMGVTP